IMFIHVSNLKPDQIQEFKGNLVNQDWLKQSLSSIESELLEYNFDLKVEKKGEFIELDGEFSGTAMPECVRCLEKFEVPLKNSFRLFLYKDEEGYVGDGGEHELKQDDMEFSIFQGDKIDVGEVLREQLILSLPDYPVCNPSCQGINT
ncbi:MAG: DUF177 domain-containing protein, partial [bacterium]